MSGAVWPVRKVDTSLSAALNFANASGSFGFSCLTDLKSRSASLYLARAMYADPRRSTVRHT